MIVLDIILVVFVTIDYVTFAKKDRAHDVSFPNKDMLDPNTDEDAVNREQ